MSANKKLFLSAVSSEFVAYRKLLAGDLNRPNLSVAVQEEFGVTGGNTLAKVDEYIRHCDAVIHLVGKATGSVPEEPAVAALLSAYPNFGTRLLPLAQQLEKPQPGFSYTQWEAYLGIYHQHPLFVYCATDFELDALNTPRDAQFVFSPEETRSQKEHFQRICALGHDRGQFLNEERLSSAVLRDLAEILPRLESKVDVSPTRLRHTAERLIGRDEDLTRLDAAWNDPHKNVVIVRAFGGMGKTSLVATWMAELAYKGWRGAERVFDWSFYSQGTRKHGAASADIFIAEALRFFGDPNPKVGSPWDRGARLAHLVGRSRCLLVLDGLEPLQHPPGPMQGQLKDEAVSTLLKGLAAQNAGLCVVTTREKVDDIKQHYGRTVEDIELTYLTPRAGAAPLHYAGATRAGSKEIAPDDKELQAASREVEGHGLTLQLLGQYLRLVENGDIRKRDTVRLADADREYQNDATLPYGHAFKTMEAYEKWFSREGKIGNRQLATLRLLGLFDRPASETCLEVLRARPLIPGLNDPLIEMTPAEWKVTLSHLEKINLISVRSDGAVDCHPLLREYFGNRLKRGSFWSSTLRKLLHRVVPRFNPTSSAWRAAHQRLYKHLCATTDEGDEPTLEDLQPLYQAVAHGCQAGKYMCALDEIYMERIQRRPRDSPLRREIYSSWAAFGAINTELATLANFFDELWNTPNSALKSDARACVLALVGYALHVLGRLSEATHPMQAALRLRIRQKDWRSAATSAGDLSDQFRVLGLLPDSSKSADQALELAHKSGDPKEEMLRLSNVAVVRLQRGDAATEEAFTKVREAQQRLSKLFPDVEPPFIYARRGFYAWDFLLDNVAAIIGIKVGFRRILRNDKASGEPKPANCLNEVSLTLANLGRETKQAIDWIRRSDILATALAKLVLGCTSHLQEVLALEMDCRRNDSERFQVSEAVMDKVGSSLKDLKRIGHQDFLPHALLIHAWLNYLTSNISEARADLDEAWNIAERGPMRLHMADIHLYRARLFFRETEYPWESPKVDLQAAEILINDCGYHRRDDELADAKLAILGK